MDLRHFLLLAVCLVTAFVLWNGLENGLLSRNHVSEPSQCTMTYMYPYFSAISMLKKSRHAPKYELYHFLDESSPSAMQKRSHRFTGIPVLFIPGNAGSFRQIRSLGSVLSHAYDSKVIPGNRQVSKSVLEFEKQQLGLNEFDFFAANFNEEFSAFNGDLLEAQAEFVTDSINRILSLYDSKRSLDQGGRNVPTSVILLGHSMGGIVARGIYLSPTYVKGTVRTILTLNTPHVIAPVLMHSSVQEFYERVNDLWQSRSGPMAAEIDDSVVLSVAGGWRDPQVHASLTSLESVAFGRKQVSVLATSVPEVWVSMDHDSCMWCNQLVVSMAAYLTEIIDPNTKQIATSSEDRLRVLQKHFQSTVPSSLGFDDTLLLQRIAMSTQPAQNPVQNQAQSKRIDSPVLRLHGPKQLSSFNGYWNLTTLQKYNRIQLITTVPLDDIRLELCSTSECVDLRSISAPIPYDIRETEPRKFVTQKAHVLDTNILQQRSFDRLQLYTSSKFPKSKHFAQENDLFLILQLSEQPRAKVDLGSHKSIGVRETSFGGDLITQFVFSEPLKYVSYQTSVQQTACISESYLKPVLLQYTDAMLHEERYAQNSLLLKLHEPTAILSRPEGLNSTQLEKQAKLNSQPMETTDLNIFVFADPLCEYHLTATFDRHSSSEILLRTYGAFVLSFLCALTMLISGAQESSAHKMLSSSSENIPTVLHALVQLVVSKRMVLLLIAIILPAKLPMFKTVDSAIDLLPGPRPDVFVLVIVLVIALGLLTVWSTVTLALFRFVESRFGHPIASHANEAAPMRLLPFETVMRMCFSRNAILAFIAIMGVGLLMDKALVVLLSLVLLLLPLPRSTLVFMNSKQKEAMMRLRHGYFVMYSITLLLLAPQLLIRLQGLQHGFSLNITVWKVIQTPLIPVFSILLRHIPPWWEPRSRYGHAIKLVGLLNVFSLLFATYDNVRSIELLTAGFLFMWALRPINL